MTKKKKKQGRYKVLGPSIKTQIILEKYLVDEIKEKYPDNTLISVIRTALKKFLGI